MKSIKKMFKAGPGPSSSHTMGPMYAIQHYKENYQTANRFKVVLYGSLALTGKGHFTDVIIKRTCEPYDVEIVWVNKLTQLEHPNTMTIQGFNDDEPLQERKYFSVGGGTIMVDTLQGSLDPDIYPEKTMAELLDVCNANNYSFADYAYLKEGKGFKEYIEGIFDVMMKAVEDGLNGEGLLPGPLKVMRRAKKIYAEVSDDPADQRNSRVASYAIAVQEVNASMGTVVTAPTCGSAGVIPAVLYYLYHDMGIEKDHLIDAFSAGGLVGNLIKANANIAGATGGCQAEIGSASSMAAAMIAYIKGLSNETVAQAAAIALEHCLGLTCDPVGGYVIFPCIERNAMYANHAFNAAQIAKASINDGAKKLSFDMVVKVMQEVSDDIKEIYKETSLGGLAKHYDEYVDKIDIKGGNC